MLHLKTVNKAIKELGIDAELVKGDGYFYFIGSAVEGANSPSVYVYRLNQLSIEQWLQELTTIINNFDHYY